MNEPQLQFDGDTYEPEHDQARLSGQMRRVFRAMQDGNWHSLAWLAERTGGSEAGVSARLRDLRKPRFGAHTVERMRSVTRKGLHLYRLRVSA